MTNEEIISGMGLIMHIASFYANPCIPDYEDWGAVSSIAEQIYEELKDDNES